MTVVGGVRVRVRDLCLYSHDGSGSGKEREKKKSTIPNPTSQSDPPNIDIERPLLGSVWANLETLRTLLGPVHLDRRPLCSIRTLYLPSATGGE